MTTSRPLVLKNSAPWRVFPLLALIPLILTGAVLAALYLNGAPLADLTTPALGMGGLVVLIFGMLSLVGLIATVGERARIERVRRDAWAVFPQFASEAAWQTWTEAEWRRERQSSGFPWASLLVITVVFAVVLGVVTTQFEAPPELYVGIGAMLVIILGIVLVGTLAGRRAARRRYQRRRSSPAPVAYVGKWGVYDEDGGFETLRGLQSVAYVPPYSAERQRAASEANMAQVFDRASALPSDPADSRDWAELRFTVRYWRAMRPDRWREGRSTFIVRVPPGREGEAQALVESYRTEVRGLRTE